jgi:DhnA family fructose-bisphosphate aldolase class Ia
MTEEAKAKGLAVVVWSYPRGHGIDKAGETAIDVVAYGAHIAALLGAHIIKVKPPTSHIAVDAAKKAIEKSKVPIETLPDRIRHVVRACFNGRRIVIFSGGEAKDTPKILEEIKGIHRGPGAPAVDHGRLRRELSSKRRSYFPDANSVATSMPSLRPHAAPASIVSSWIAGSCAANLRPSGDS